MNERNLGEIPQGSPDEIPGENPEKIMKKSLMKSWE